MTKEKLIEICAANLTDKQYLYIRMHYIDDLSMREISRQCGVNVSSVSRGIQYALKHLRDLGYVIEKGCIE